MNVAIDWSNEDQNSSNRFENNPLLQQPLAVAEEPFEQLFLAVIKILHVLIAGIAGIAS